MKIRNYNEKDKDAVQSIFEKYWTDREFLDEIAQNMNSSETHFYVAEREGDIVGVAGLKKAPDHLRTYADTENPAELYIVASKLQNEGIGSALVQRTIEEAKGLSFTEIECYSPETHNSSWKFYEDLGFTKEGIIKDPEDGHPGMLWRKVIS